MAHHDAAAREGAVVEGRGRVAASSYGNWSVGPDGRFVMVKADPTTSRQLRVVLDWFDELGRR